MKRSAVLLVLAVITVWTLDRLAPPDLSRIAHPAQEMRDRSDHLLALRPAPGGVWRIRTTTDDVDPAFIERLIAIEDRHFRHHPGVNPLALARAAFQDLRAGRIVSGGSTLTMQVARLLEPRPRTIRAKLIEIARALQLEARFSKNEILGMWLTLAPYGGNLEGVRAGSLAWLNKSPSQLEDSEIALLVAIPRRPEALRPDRHAQRAEALRNRILHAEAGPVDGHRHPMPRHAAQALSWSNTPIARSTIDLNLQIAVEAVARSQATTLPQGAATAVLIADLKTRDILALASATNGPQGRQLDLTRAVRSPGSALKPFVYAMAFEAGLAGPETLLDDLPRRFGTYAPEDFDRVFQGRVTMADALRRSLNLPAVALLAELGPGQFLERLRSSGVTLHLPATTAGMPASLPLALGGLGITLREAAGLYAALGQDGTVTPLHLSQNTTPNITPNATLGTPLVSPRAAATIAGILTQPFPDGGPDGIAWKTGTSWGGRDAWALGFDGQHVAAAWVGRPDSTPLPGATGRGLALPVLARLMSLLPSAPRPATKPIVLTATAPRPDALRLLFPPPQAVVSADGPFTVRAMGGRRPLTFLMDNTRLPSEPAKREVGWRPPSPGFYRLVVLDADGQAVTSQIRVR